MEVESFEVIRLELKYCERCGGLWLWLRLQDVEDVYCALCMVEMLELPAPRRVASRPRLPGEPRIPIAGKPTPLVICAKGGTA